MKLYSAHPCALTLHFYTGPFILNFAQGAEKEDVNIFNLAQFFKSELICYLKAAKAPFSLGGVLHRSLIAD